MCIDQIATALSALGYRPVCSRLAGKLLSTNISMFCSAIARGKSLEEACEVSGLNPLQGRHVLADREIRQILQSVSRAHYLSAARECGLTASNIDFCS